MIGAFAAAPRPAYRLIASRFPPVDAFDTVASAEDARAVMELEGWTNDRLVAERLVRLPESEWVYGRPNASVVMAAFLHTAPAGLRFSSPDLGAWYAAASLTTCAFEVAHHLRREIIARKLVQGRRVYRAYAARLEGSYLDICGQREACPDLYASDSYAASQLFGEQVRRSEAAGILYDSVRHEGGTNVVAYRPRNILDVAQSAHYEIIVPARGKVIMRALSGSSS